MSASTGDPSRGDKSTSFTLGKGVTVTVPEAVAEQVGAVFGEVFGRRKAAGRSARESAERLSADRIVEVALDQMREHGYDAVTMRSIARELDTGPASLYAHVASREELDALVLDRVAGQWQVPDPDPDRWDEQLVEAMRAMRDLYRAHPGVARASMGMIPMHPGALMGMERLLAILRAGGVPDQDAAWFCDLMALYIGAIAVEEDIWRMRAERGGMKHDHDEHSREVRDFMARLPAEHFPITSSMAVELASGDGDDRFDFGARVLVAGLKARAEAARG